MAMQSGIGFYKIIILVGAGYGSTILIQNGKLSDVIDEIQSLLKGLDKSDDKINGESDYSDAIAAQVRRLAMEVRQLASARQITVLNGNSGQIGNLSSLVIPAATLGALGYGYMWWKGIKFSDLMYVTKQSMSNAVSNLTSHLEHVSEALSATKKYLTQRIENLDEKLDDQKELSKLIKNEVSDVRGDLSQIGVDLDALNKMVSGLDGKIGILEHKQDVANMGVMYLCNIVDGKKVKMSEDLREQLQLSGRSCGLITQSEKPSLMGLKDIGESLGTGIMGSDATMHDNIDKLNNQPRLLMRVASTKC